MPSEELQLLVAGYVLGDLNPEEAAAFEQLLAQDPAIADAVTQLQTALETGYAPREVSPPPHLRTAILAKAANGADSASAIAQQGKVIPWRGLLEGAAAVIIVALGIHNYALRQMVQLAQEKSPQDNAVTYVLNATSASSEASATVIVNPDNLEAAIAVKNLPPLPPGKVYALWTVVDPNAPVTTDDKKAILTEVFEVDAQGNFTRTAAVPKVYRSKNLVTKVAITVEDATAPQKHLGKPVMLTGS